MKIKLLSAAVLSIIILPLLIKITFAVECTGNCMDASTCTERGLPITAGSCDSGYVCCNGTAQNTPTPTNTITPTSPTSATSITLPNPLNANNIPDLINNIVSYLIGIASIILPLVIIYAAFLLMTAGGEMEKVVMGRKTITWAVVGYILILISKGIAVIVANILGAK